MSLHSELMAALEALTEWSGVSVHSSFVQRGVSLPFATVMQIPATQFNHTGGAHPVFSHAAFRITTYAKTSQSARTLIDAAYEHLRDFSGNLIVSGSRDVAAADCPETPADDVTEPVDASDTPLYSSTFLVNLIHSAS